MLKIKEVIKLMLEDGLVAEDVPTEKGIAKLLSWQEEATRKELGEWLDGEGTIGQGTRNQYVNVIKQEIEALKQGKMPGGDGKGVG